jgi:hypothetical protein
MHAQESGSNDHAFVSDVAVSSNDHLVIFSAQLVAYVPKNVITLLNHACKKQYKTFHEDLIHDFLFAFGDFAQVTTEGRWRNGCSCDLTTNECRIVPLKSQKKDLPCCS